MIKNHPALKIPLNEKGILTLDFLFAFFLVFGFTLIMLALSMTLSVIEVTQYITFASARNYIASHVSQAKQTDLGKQKFKELTSNPVLKPLFKANWYGLSNLEVGPEADARFQEEYDEPNKTDSSFNGVRVTMNAKVMEIRIPVFGKTFEDEDGFKTKISSFLIREPTFDECNDFNMRRFQAIRALDSDYSKAGSDNAYAVIGDNGC